jgi:hypothetical protein
MNERKRRKEGKKNWKNQIIDEVIDLEIIASANEAYFGKKVRELGKEFPAFSREEISYFSGKINNFREVKIFFETYLLANKLAIENKDLILTLENHLETYTILKKYDKLLNWKQTVIDFSKTAQKNNLHLIHTFEISKLLKSAYLVSNFFDFYKENKELNIQEQVDYFKQSFEQRELYKTPFDMEQEKHKYPLSVLMQESYRDDPRDSSHFFEHAMSRMDRD